MGAQADLFRLAHMSEGMFSHVVIIDRCIPFNALCSSLPSLLFKCVTICYFVSGSFLFEMSEAAPF